MTSNKAIELILHSINEGKTGEVYKVAENYIKSLSTNGDSYRLIKRQLNMKPQSYQVLQELNSKVKNLLIQYKHEDSSVYLNPEVKFIVDDLLTEWSNAELLRAHNLPVRNKILLHGPTGNGKTTIARNIAKLSGLPFIEVNADAVITSSLGGTGTNIHNIFANVSEGCILFWDEVDTIGIKRGGHNNSSAGHENDRMVNSMLTNIDRLAKDVILIGATNRMDMLDAAFLRRFDTCVAIPKPSEEEKRDFSEMLINEYKLPSSHVPDDLTDLQSFSDVKRNITESARLFVLSKVLKKC